jgi:acyl-CoA thioester hydrolase
LGRWREAGNGIVREHGEQAGDGAGEDDDSALAGWLTAAGHAYKARIYYADTDFSGFVYHARYLEFLERGRSDYLRLAGIRHSDLAGGLSGKPVVWVVRRMEIDFLSPARIDDIVEVETVTTDIGGARIHMAQTIAANGRRLIFAKVEAVTVTPEGRPVRFPRDWLNRLKPPQSV